jgi:hypothetical protein
MDWDGRTHFWSGLIKAPFYLVWKLLTLILGLLWRFFKDVAKTVYGKIVLIVAGAIIVALVGYASSLLR